MDSVLNVFPLKAPEELLDIMKDLQSCVDKAQEKKAKKKKKKQGEASFTVMTILPHIVLSHHKGTVKNSVRADWKVA